MDGAELMQGAITLMLAMSPLILGYTAIIYAERLIGLIYKAFR